MIKFQAEMLELEKRRLETEGRHSGGYDVKNRDSEASTETQSKECPSPQVVRQQLGHNITR